MNYNGLTFKIGTSHYSVKETAGLIAKQELFGHVAFTDNQIEIEESLCDQRKQNVIVHEVVHAILYEAGYDEQNKEQVIRIGNVLTQVLRDNIFGFLQDKDGIIETPNGYKFKMEELY